MKTSLPPILESKLADFRRRVWMVKLAEALLAAACGLALSYVAVFALDRFVETPGWLRGLLLAAGAAGLGIGVPVKWHRWVWRQRKLEDAARLLRRKHPRLGDQLLGIVELARFEQGDAGRSERLVTAAMDQAAAAVLEQDFANAVPQARHRRWAWAAGSVVALGILAFGVVNEAAHNALARWLAPWADIERFTFARVEQVPPTMVVPLAEPFDLNVTLSKDTRWSPETARSRIKGQPVVEARRQDDAFRFALPPQKETAPMKVSLGDVRKKVEVKPVPRPEMVSLSAKLRLPSYLQYQSEPLIEVRSGTISVLRGAQASFVAKTSRALAAAAVDGGPQRVEGDRIITDYQSVVASVDHRFDWTDRDGLTPREPLTVRVQAVEDEAPKVAVSRETQEQVVMDSEIVTFDLNGQDDFGIKRMGLEWKAAEGAADFRPATPKSGERIAFAGEPERREIEGRATFCAEREGLASGSYEIRGWAEDYLNGGRRAHSAAFLLHVMSKSEHALWLTDQFGKWLQLARETYEREQQLHATNRELRQLSATDLDRPENRRRMAQQAVAETANAQRLDALVEGGRRLIEQATRNPEFEASRLESWAMMSKSLKEIAARRMPSVTDWLKQSANATGRSEGWQPSQQSALQTGAGQPGLANAESNKPEAQTEKLPGQAQAASSDAKAAPSVKSGEGNQDAQSARDGSSVSKVGEPVPSVADREKGLVKDESKPGDSSAKPGQPGQGRLGLPSTQLAAAPGAPKAAAEEAGIAPPESPAQEKLNSALWEQRDLLAEFAKVTDQLQQVLASLEASTFVKRLKFASRRQFEIASGLGRKTLGAFGLVKASVQPEPAAHGVALAQEVKKESETVAVIQGDLEAYFQRKQDARFKRILDQMKGTEIVSALARVSEDVGSNLSGQSISTAEFWADTLDRWAEELVAASQCESCSGAGGDSLPPEIVLQVMQILRDEMKLRDETREMENSRPALDMPVYARGAMRLASNQARISTRTRSTMTDIVSLPNGAKSFIKELQLLDLVSRVMDEAQQELEKPVTGAPAIAAETEAIELLLQARRPNPKGGGGGGGSPGGGGTAETASQAALAEFGPGAEAGAGEVNRDVGQSTGRSGREFPEEFKTGLDAYFNNLEKSGASK